MRVQLSITSLALLAATASAQNPITTSMYLFDAARDFLSPNATQSSYSGSIVEINPTGTVVLVPCDPNPADGCTTDQTYTFNPTGTEYSDYTHSTPVMDSSVMLHVTQHYMCTPTITFLSCEITETARTVRSDSRTAEESSMLITYLEGVTAVPLVITGGLEKINAAPATVVPWKVVFAAVASFAIGVGIIAL